MFSKLHLRYDGWLDSLAAKKIFELELRCVREAFQKMPKFYLEVEAGTGRFAEKLETDFGVDPSREMLKVAPSLFGAVAVIVTLCFLDDPLRALKECFSLLFCGPSLHH